MRSSLFLLAAGFTVASCALVAVPFRALRSFGRRRMAPAAAAASTAPNVEKLRFMSETLLTAPEVHSTLHRPLTLTITLPAASCPDGS